MKPRDKISKSVWTLHATVKDDLARNVTTAVRGGQLKIEASQLPILLGLIASSVDEGANKGHSSLMRAIDASLREAASDAALDANFPLQAKKN